MSAELIARVRSLAEYLAAPVPRDPVNGMPETISDEMVRAAASREMLALCTTVETLTAERDAAREDVRRLIEQNDETTREWGESIEAGRAELATLRETLVGAVRAEKLPVPVTHFDDCARLVYGKTVECDCRYLSKQASNTHHNAALDRAITVIKDAK